MPEQTSVGVRELMVTKIGRKSMLGVEEPKDLRRASLVSEIYSEAADPLTAELAARGRTKKSSSVGLADYGNKFKKISTNPFTPTLF